MRKSSMVIGTAALLTCTAAVVAQERPPQLPSERAQPPAEIVAPPARAATPNRETTGLATCPGTLPGAPSRRTRSQGEGKHEEEDQTTPSAPRR
jgi:hypothetical protein